MLECVVNISEGRDRALIDALASAADGGLIDLHSDRAHNRSVFTIAGRDAPTFARAISTVALGRLDLRHHEGVHPRLGVVDVVPFVPIGAELVPEGDLDEAIAARDDFARWAGDELALPCFIYGPERSLPDIRRGAFRTLRPDFGPNEPHPSAGACCVGARRALVAYNVVLEDDDAALAHEIATKLRSPSVRALGFEVEGEAQVSFNLVEPWSVGPADVYDGVAQLASIRRAELVGLLPARVLDAIPTARWPSLGLSGESTIEARVASLDRAVTP